MARRDEEFFYEHAGYAYDPKTETPEQGRRRMARELARAEQWAWDNDYDFVWEDEPEDWRMFLEDTEIDSEEVSGIYVLTMVDSNDEVVQALGGIVEGDDAELNRIGRRVFEAELAAEERAEHVPQKRGRKKVNPMEDNPGRKKKKKNRGRKKNRKKDKRSIKEWAEDEPVLGTATGAGVGSLIGAGAGWMVGAPGVGSIAGGAIGGYAMAPEDRKKRGAWGGGIGGAFTPIGAAAGGAIAGRKPDRKNNPEEVKKVRKLKAKLLK